MKATRSCLWTPQRSDLRRLSVKTTVAVLFPHKLALCCVPAQLENRQCFDGSFSEIKNAKSPRAPILCRRPRALQFTDYPVKFEMIKSPKEQKEPTRSLGMGLFEEYVPTQV